MSPTDAIACTPWSGGLERLLGIFWRSPWLVENPLELSDPLPSSWQTFKHNSSERVLNWLGLSLLRNLWIAGYQEQAWQNGQRSELADEHGQ